MFTVDIASVTPILGLPTLSGHSKYQLDPHMSLLDSGLTKASIEALKSATGLTWQQIADALHITVRTLQRYQADQQLPTTLSERLMRIADVYAKGFDVFGDHAMFRKWMQEPVPALSQVVPQSLLPSLYGMDRLMQELGRIEHGILA